MTLKREWFSVAGGM